MHVFWLLGLTLLQVAGAGGEARLTREQLAGASADSPARVEVVVGPSDRETARIVVECDTDCGAYKEETGLTPEPVEGGIAFLVHDILTREGAHPFKLQRDGSHVATVVFSVKGGSGRSGGSQSGNVEAPSVPADPVLHFRLHVENDLGTSDVNYTNGLRLEVGRSATTLPGWLKWMEWFYPPGSPTRTFGFVLAQNMYTPTDIETPDIVPYARPYAGWLYGGMYLLGVDAEQDAVTQLEVDIGWFGEGLAGVTQRWWHARRFINAPEPRGWRHHVGNEVGFRAMFNWQKRAYRFGPASHAYFDVWGLARAEVGNIYTAPSIGALVRLGRFSAIPPGATMPSAFVDEKRPDVEAYVFARLESRLVVWNGTLQGGWFSTSPHTVPARRFVTIGDFGLHASVYRWFLEWSRVSKSPEVANSRGDPFGHSYWQIQLGRSY